MIKSHMCPDCKHFWISCCPSCNSVIGHCRKDNDVHPLGVCPDFEGGDEE